MSSTPLTMVAIIALLGLGCHAEPDPSASADGTKCNQRPVRIAIASSLREIASSVERQIAARNENVPVESIFGASSMHARQLRLGAPIDVFVSADAEIVDELVESGFLVRDSRLEFARGQLSLVSRANWVSGERGLDALASPELRRMAIPSVAVPLGRYARTWLELRELSEGLAGKIVTTEHARASLTAVDAGHVDLAIVYRTDTRLARHARPLARIDALEHPPIRYVAARSTSAPSCASIDDALATWTSDVTLEALAQAGFLPPESARVH